MSTHADKSVVFPGGSTYTVDGRTVELPTGVTSSAITFTFNPLGEPSPAVTHTVDRARGFLSEIDTSPPAASERARGTSAVLGIALMVVGLVISLTVVGAPVGLPLAIVGFLLLLRAFF